MSQSGLLEPLNYFMTIVITETAPLRDAISQGFFFPSMKQLKSRKDLFCSQFQRFQTGQLPLLYGDRDEVDAIMPGRHRRDMEGTGKCLPRIHPH